VIGDGDFGYRAMFRLGEEQDQFCPVCKDQWENRHGDIPLGPSGNCHVCLRRYEHHDLLMARPVTHRDSGKASICCGECFDAISAMSLGPPVAREVQRWIEANAVGS